jgi:hypothetical protein
MTDGDESAFDRFVRLWPARVKSRGTVLAAWLTAVDGPATAQAVLAAVEAERQRWLAEGVPPAAGWLKGKGWLRPGEPASAFPAKSAADRARWNGTRDPDTRRGG